MTADLLETDVLSRGVKPFSTEPEGLCPGVFRICVPFEDIFTSVYVLTTTDAAGVHCAVLDSADKAADVEAYLFPFLRKRGLIPEFLICSHFHGDHCGGGMAVLDAYPACRAIGFAPTAPFPRERWGRAVEGMTLFDRYRLQHLPGHTDDSLAVYDVQNKLLLTCDCLQLCGVSRYGTGITDANAYIRSVAAVGMLDVETLVAAHNFVPLGDIADGAAAVSAYLQMCIDTLKEIKMFIDTHEKDCADDTMLARAFNDTHASHPPLDAGKLAAIRQLDLTLL